MAERIKKQGSDFQRNQFSASQTYATQPTPGLGYFPTFPSAIPTLSSIIPHLPYSSFGFPNFMGFAPVAMPGAVNRQNISSMLKFRM
ncbi:hypothetical protein HK096_003132 [Nowakowskiella sp. JEL0078]|nr:hypothetical protein HK096_003132 [Nowakowskiella sp. JEL0078]